MIENTHICVEWSRSGEAPGSFKGAATLYVSMASTLEQMSTRQNTRAQLIHYKNRS